MTAIAETAIELPPVTVDCSRCGHQWLSGAKRHTVLRCPHCGHAVRVKRPPTLDASRPEDAPTGHPPAAPATSAVPPDPGAKDDGETYIYDDHGRLVLAEWTADGYLIPARPPIDHAAELAARHYRISRTTEPGQCQIIAERPLGQDWLAAQECPGAATQAFGTARICDRHHRALTTPLKAA